MGTVPLLLPTGCCKDYRGRFAKHLRHRTWATNRTSTCHHITSYPPTESVRRLWELLIEPFRISVALPPPQESPKCRMVATPPLASRNDFPFTEPKGPQPISVLSIQNFNNQIKLIIQVSQIGSLGMRKLQHFHTHHSSWGDPPH
jgi:hypothetical protein